ncbi:type 1 glutamine amidotransferase [Pseudomonas sp. MSSRFD41]|uniref:type 1 glutamine amidotransferase n=1 Tax=unclassified Pseudomonas TaxID=196821 RepID=UPI00163B0D50|nr:type 1 glutamine amidotransferase [Pseudomonas sp. MSSRFD41]MBC2654474.1 type 1 glutamine amidotransferase [Pseudomonas sp. MSSRFD41]
MRVLILQHSAAAGPGRINQWLLERATSVHICHLHAQARLPRLDSFDLLILLGGPMSVHDEIQAPWLVAEKRLLRKALSAGKRVLGIGLGGQLLAQALGARVRPCAASEIGWWPVEKYPSAQDSPLGLALPERLMAFHWHGESFDLPKGALPLYRSAACANQGFIWQERAIGLQCLLQSDLQSIEALLQSRPQGWLSAEQDAGPETVEDRQAIIAGIPHCSGLAPTLFRMLDYLSGPLPTLR